MRVFILSTGGVKLTPPPSSFLNVAQKLFELLTYTFLAFPKYQHQHQNQNHTKNQHKKNQHQHNIFRHKFCVNDLEQARTVFSEIS